MPLCNALVSSATAFRYAARTPTAAMAFENGAGIFGLRAGAFPDDPCFWLISTTPRRCARPLKARERVANDYELPVI
jgi:hypothetical protein